MKLLGSPLFWLFFVIPMTVGSLYYFKFASKQYEASAHFTIEENGTSNIDPLAALTGLSGSASSTRDALIIKNFIESREAIEQIKNDVDIKSIYARPDKDWFSRLEADASIEEIVEYWQKKVRVDFDHSSSIITLSAMAFEPEQAMRIVQSILRVSETLVNNLSEKARQDTLKFAEKELAKSEANLKEARKKVMLFRNSEKSLDPEKNVETQITLVAGLEAELANSEAELRSLRISLQDAAPKVQAARNRVSALKSQISKEKARGLTTGKNGAKNNLNLSKLITEYEELMTEQGFAEKSYASTLLIMEQARIDAARQHRYLTVIVTPQLPEKEIKPDLPHDFIVLLLSSLLFWGISGLVIASIKDHAGWV